MTEPDRAVDGTAGRRSAAEMPEQIRLLLDGSSPRARLGHALTFLTADIDLTPRVCVLSPGEVLAAGKAEVRLAIDERSRTLANAERSGRGTLVIFERGICCYLRGRVRRLEATVPAGESHPFRSACLALAVEEAIADAERGAFVEGGVTYRRELEEDRELELWHSFWSVLREAQER